MKLINNCFIIILLMTLAACGGASTQDQYQEESNVEGPIRESAGDIRDANVYGDTNEELARDVIEAYLNMKNALILEDTVAVQKFAAELVGDFAHTSSTTDLQAIRLLAINMKKLEGLAEQRYNFKSLSTEVYDLAKSAEVYPVTLYRIYCPVGYNDEGAYWLSSSEIIENPYYTGQYSNCGEVQEVIGEFSEINVDIPSGGDI